MMTEFDCASCEDHVCREGVDCYGYRDRVMALYEEAGELERRMMDSAAAVEAEGYMHWPRALEIVQFARKAGFAHLGVAFCVGLAGEARVFADQLEKRFTVSSVCCKVCGIDKGEYGLPLLHPEKDEEAMCSPLGQAELLNEAGTELNVLLGLCVGHDALFTSRSAAPVTTLIAKDRVLAHNPAGAIYSPYWRKRLETED